MITTTVEAFWIERERERGRDLSSNYGDGGKGVPESGQSTLLAVIAEGGARPLYFVHQLYQILHCQNNTESTR